MTDTEKLALVYKKYKKLQAAIFAVKFYLDKPYPDDERWTPYTRFVGPAEIMVQEAFKGQDVGELWAMGETDTEEPRQYDADGNLKINGQEWFERFEKELAQLHEDYFYNKTIGVGKSDVWFAAKKAAGIE